MQTLLMKSRLNLTFYRRFECVFIRVQNVRDYNILSYNTGYCTVIPKYVTPLSVESIRYGVPRL